MKKYENGLSLRKARYWCFRFKTEAEGGSEASDAPSGFKDYVENLEGFGGWKKFAISWDIKGENPFYTILKGK